MTDFQEFAEHNWGGLTGRVPIALLDSQREPRKQKFFQWPEQKEDLFEYVDEVNAQGIDAYTTSALFKANRAMKSVVKSLQVVHADDDGFTAAGGTYLLDPSLTVHTSEGHAHQYWLIDDCQDPVLIEALSHAVSNEHSKAEGVDHCWAMNHLFRVPGSSNTKYETPYVSTAEFTGATYSYDEFAAVYSPVDTVQVQQTVRGDLPTFSEALASIAGSSVLDNLLDKGYTHNVDRSDALHLLQQEVFRLGGTDEVAFVICQNSPVNKFADRSGGDEKLWQDVLRGRAKSGISFDTELVDDEVEVTVAPTRKDRSVDFLSAEEKDRMAPTFIDEYTAWATSKTDAATDFHIASAFTILSTVFSDFGHAYPKFGPLPLNLWFMVLGETTRSRKSTTRGQMLKFIRALETKPGEEPEPSDDDTDKRDTFTYDLGSDVTPEGLDNALLARPWRSALFHRDEVQGWLAELESKAYMAGAKGKFTELFDGHVSGKLRSTGEVKRQASANVALSMYVMGIRSQVADFLTQEDFQSGFLTRFIFVEADAPARTKESDYLEQGNPDEARRGDPVFEGLLGKLEQARTHWNGFVQADGPTQAVVCSNEAWARLNEFIIDVLDAAEGHERHTIIEAASQRLSLSILKAATLLAMYDCCDGVELPHMLSAINFCSTWFSHMVSMANRVSQSMWARRQDQVEDFVLTKGGDAPWTVVYRKFSKDMKPREFAEVIQALDEAGRIHTRWSNGTSGTRHLEVLMQDSAVAA